MLGFCKKYRKQEDLGEILVACLPEHLMAIQLLKPPNREDTFHATWAKGQALDLKGISDVALKVTVEGLGEEKKK